MKRTIFESSQKLAGDAEGGKRPTAGDEGCEVRAQNLAPLLQPEGGRRATGGVPPFIEKLPIFLLVPVFIIAILCYGWVQQNLPIRQNVQEKIKSLVTRRDPLYFFSELKNSVGGLNSDFMALRNVMYAFEEIIKTGSFADVNTCEGIWGYILVQNGYYRRGVQQIERAIFATKDTHERNSLLWCLGFGQRNLRNLAGLASTVQELKAAGYDDGELKTFLVFLQKHSSGNFNSGTWLFILLWLVLLILPIWFVKYKIANFRKLYSDSQDKRAVYLVFRSSPASLLACLVSVIFLFSCRVPIRLGIEMVTLTGLVHFLFVYIVCLYETYELDKSVREVTWSFSQYFLTVVRLNFLQTFYLLVLFLTLMILRQMAENLPMWGVGNPMGLSLGLPAIGGAIILLTPYFLPWMLGGRRFRKDEGNPWKTDATTFYNWRIPNSGFYNAFTFGYLSLMQGILITSPLLEEFSPEETRAIVAHEIGHLNKRHLFQVFGIIFDGFLALGFLAVLFPVRYQKLLLTGPSTFELLPGFIVFLAFNQFLKKSVWKFELEADSCAAREVGRESYIEALQKLYEKNFFPTRWRESDSVRSSHPSLQTRIRTLREKEGEYFQPTEIPSFELLRAFWQGRLALEWKLGEGEAVEICALDDDLSGNSLSAQFEIIARRHARYGAAVLKPMNKNGLEILNCRQKACATLREPVLPKDKICLLCRGGMFKALGRNGLWRETSSGCFLELPN